MKQIKLLPVIGLAFFAGCATTKAPTSAERLANVGESFTETDRQLSEAEKELASFEKSVANLRTSASKQPGMRTKASFDEAFGRLNTRIEETRLDLQQLKVANERGRNAYSEQMSEAASKIERSTAEEPAE